MLRKERGTETVGFGICEILGPQSRVIVLIVSVIDFSVLVIKIKKRRYKEYGKYKIVLYKL